MTKIDPEICTKFVMSIADRIAKEGPRAAKVASIGDQIGHVRAVSAKAEGELRDALARLYPAIPWTGETDRPTTAEYWLYDPIDGAYHYLQGLPLWSSSLCLVQDGRPVFSVVYDPTLGEVFVAEEGDGVTCNGEQVAISPKTNVNAAVVGTTIPPLLQVGEVEQDEALLLVREVARTAFVVRPMAAVSLQLAYVAAGRLDAYWENGPDIADWLAGSLLVREAGGEVSDLYGLSLRQSGEGIIASNAALRVALLPVISRTLAIAKE